MDRRLFLQSAVATGIAASFSSQRALAAQFSALTKISADVPAVSYIRKYWKSLEWATDGYYTVDSADESDKVRHGNYQGNFPRLREVKKKYDPTNLFRLNANIKA